MEELAVGVAELAERARSKRAPQEKASRVDIVGIVRATIGIRLARIQDHNLPHEVGHIGVWASS